MVLLIEDNPGHANLGRERLDDEDSVYSACQHIAYPCYVRERPDSESYCYFHSTSTGPPRLRPAESGLPRGRPT